MRPLTTICLSALCAASAQAANSGFIVDYALFDHVFATADGVFHAGEYDHTPITMSTATGGGGVLHSPGNFYINTQSTSLTLGFQPGAALSNTVVMLLNYQNGGRARGSGGGVTTINDTTDAARRALSSLQGQYLVGSSSGADAAITINSDGFGFFLFPDDQHSTFTQVGSYIGVTNAGTGFREAEFAPSFFGGMVPAAGFDFTLAYAGDSFLFNEAIPAQPYSGGANPGAAVTDVPNFYTLAIFIPAPGSAGLLAGGAMLFSRRSRRTGTP
jgi:hypothetical protein